MSTKKCINAYGNESKDGHIYVTGHDGCARCGAPSTTARRTTAK